MGFCTDGIRLQVKICAKRADPTCGRSEQSAFRHRDTKRGEFFLSERHLLCRHADNQAEGHQKRPPIESNIQDVFKRIQSGDSRQCSDAESNFKKVESYHLPRRCIFHTTGIPKSNFGHCPQDASKKTFNSNGFENDCLLAWLVTRLETTCLKMRDLSKEHIIAWKKSSHMDRSRCMETNSYGLGSHQSARKYIGFWLLLMQEVAGSKHVRSMAELLQL